MSACPQIPQLVPRPQRHQAEGAKMVMSGDGARDLNAVWPTHGGITVSAWKCDQAARAILAAMQLSGGRANL